MSASGQPIGEAAGPSSIPPSDPETLLADYDNALACARDHEVFAEIDEEFAPKLDALAREHRARAHRTRTPPHRPHCRAGPARSRRGGAMTDRLTTRERLALFLAAKGRCQRCHLVITPGRRWEVDHVVPRAMGGGGRRANLQVLCAPCHGAKTRTEDVPRIAKSKRVQARHLGAWRPDQHDPRQQTERLEAEDGRHHREAAIDRSRANSRGGLQAHQSSGFGFPIRPRPRSRADHWTEAE